MYVEKFWPTAWIHIVDDDLEVRRSTGLMVQTLGYGALTYRTAEAFLEQYEPKRCDCLLLDLRLPGMTGAELQEVLHARSMKLPVIAMTASAPKELVEHSRNAGALTVLAKPFRLAALEPLLRQAVGV